MGEKKLEEATKIIDKMKGDEKNRNVSAEKFIEKGWQEVRSGSKKLMAFALEKIKKLENENKKLKEAYGDGANLESPVINIDEIEHLKTSLRRQGKEVGG